MVPLRDLTSWSTGPFASAVHRMIVFEAPELLVPLIWHADTAPLT